MHVAREVLYNCFPHHWVGLGGNVSWPPNSPDLTSLDFFLWGKLNDDVYKDPTTTPGDMKQCITVHAL
jgi:hypothetical protein